MNKKILKDYIYSLLYQILLITSPILTLPYKTRVLSKASIGIYSYVFSIITYIIMIGSLGISLYGRREIGYVKEDHEKRSKVFYELLFLKIITFTIIIIISSPIILQLKNCKSYYFIILIEVFINIFDITWFYQGIEKFKKLSIINSINKILNILSIFIFIKSDSDLIKYFIITLIFDIIPLAILLITAKKHLKKLQIKKLEIKKHLKPCILLFIPQICIQIYTTFDKIMLGSLQNNISEVGIYEYSYKIIVIILQSISTLVVIMIPIIAQEFKNNNYKKIKNYTNKSINYTLFMAIPFTFGLLAITNNLVLIIFGKDYFDAIQLIKILAFSIIPMSLTTIIGNQYLVSIKEEKKFVKYIFFGAIINIILNIILIPKYASLGASTATLITEVVILLIETPIIMKIINKKETLKNILKYIIYSIIMFFVVKLISYIECTVFILTIEIIIGVLIYVLILFITKDKLFLNIVNVLKRK